MRESWPGAEPLQTPTPENPKNNNEKVTFHEGQKLNVRRGDMSLEKDWVVHTVADKIITVHNNDPENPLTKQIPRDELAEWHHSQFITGDIVQIIDPITKKAEDGWTVNEFGVNDSIQLVKEDPKTPGKIMEKVVDHKDLVIWNKKPEQKK